MSGAVQVIAPVATVALNVIEDFVILKPARNIGGIIPDVTIEENHSDRLEITHHPVELGANISDHAYMQPFEVTLRYAWSDSDFLRPPGFSVIAYEQLQALQQSRTPFAIITGKRLYTSMLLQEIQVTTDNHSENALMVTLHCQQVIIVTTQSASLTPTQTNAAQAQSQIDRGNVQTVPTASTPQGITQFAPAGGLT